ncbi:PAS domain S-box-containing protein/diguanylate cyclase (GGDEF) domain-containing protein [Paucidesulfovibrio gracilis DSM 16080]|uniref:diguanylate cyclase n=2 Tax=Paucidesulfovibrio TaxID=2910985 RepID=A0A1T4XPT5_9BACT|nr:PAS domain S-box-containing protein/diguanylate cyclase (GGDEF) domain-containing protein [Paucidesulfovibrio gracilis DSM 16080]
MSLIGLDVRTLAFITVLSSFCFGAGLILFGMSHRSFQSLKVVGLGFVAMGFGFLLIGFRGAISDALSIVAANSLLLAGFATVNEGIQRFRSLPIKDRGLATVVVALGSIAFFIYTYLSPSITARVFGISCCLALLSGLCIKSMLRKNSRRTQLPQQLIAGVFFLFVAFALLRGWWVLDETTMRNFMSAGVIHALAFLITILLQILVSFGLVWMANEHLIQELKLHERIISSTPDAITLVDGKGRYRMVNAAMQKMFGMSEREMFGKRSVELLGKEFYDSVTWPNLQKVFKGQIGKTATWTNLPNGERRYVDITYHPVSDETGKIRFAAINVKDLTELYLAQKDRERIYELSLDLLCVAGMDGYLKEINPAWTKVLGWSEQELLHTKWLDFVHPDDVQETLAAASLLDQGKKLVDFVNRYRTKQGTYKYFSWMSYPDNAAGRIYAVVRDVSDRVKMEEKLREMASTDPLTGADNRRSFMQRLEEETARSGRYQTPLCLLMLDIDRFKSINDTHGHTVGDAVLQLCVEVCKNSLRSSDIFGRFGGEEFSAVLPHTALNTGTETAERLRQNLERCILEKDNGKVQFTVSIGVAGLRSGETVQSLLKRADDALYRAKKAGRNKVETDQDQ